MPFHSLRRAFFSLFHCNYARYGAASLCPSLVFLFFFFPFPPKISLLVFITLHTVFFATASFLYSCSFPRANCDLGDFADAIPHWPLSLSAFANKRDRAFIFYDKSFVPLSSFFFFPYFFFFFFFFFFFLQGRIVRANAFSS
jgi:hypothetical protein